MIDMLFTRKRFRILSGLLDWLRRRTFESVKDESEGRHSSRSEDEEDISEDDMDRRDDDMSGYLDVTIEDLYYVNRSRSETPLTPIQEETRLPLDIHVHHEDRSPFTPPYQRYPMSNLRSPSGMSLSRSRVLSPRILNNNYSPSDSATSPNFSMVKVVKPQLLETKFVRSRTQESFQGSLESIDSLVESYWDPEDDASHITPVATNLARSSDFFYEHVRFLRVQTQPRQVEVVWNTPPHKRPPTPPLKR